MAQKVEVRLVDDIDGSDADETVQFGLDGVTYEIDLSDDNADQLRSTLAEYIGHARKAGGTRRAGRATGGGRRRSGGTETAAIRAWAREQGLAVSERGRIPASIVEQYEAAH
jgi:hypothetical protein